MKAFFKFVRLGAVVVSLFLFMVNMMNKKHQKLNITNKMKLVQI
jgi:hypothetical protein